MHLKVKISVKIVGKEAHSALVGHYHRTLGEKIKLSLSSALTSMNVEPVENNDEHNEFFMFLPLRMK